MFPNRLGVVGCLYWKKYTNCINEWIYVLVMVQSCKYSVNITAKQYGIYRWYEIYLPNKFFIDFLQGFYIYIYTVSIIFLIYAYVYLLRNKSLKLRRNLRRNHYSSPSSGSRSNLKRKYSFDDSRTYHTGSFYLRLGAVGRQMHLRIFWFANKWYVQKNKEFWLYFVIYLRSFTLYFMYFDISKIFYWFIY